MNCLISITVALTLIFTTYLTTNYLVEKYIQDNQCVIDLVSQGIPRSDIHQEDGVCIEELNAYYKYK